MKTPLISIIIPAWNRANLIDETLTSVFNQTYQDWECLIIDDGSTDHTEDIVNNWVLKDSRFHYSKRDREPKGAPTCRNIGIEKARGKYVIFLDTDDLLAAFCLERRIEAFKDHSTCDFLVFSAIEFKQTITDTNILVNIPTKQDPVERFLNLDVPWLIMCPIWKKTSLIKLDGFKETALSWQDWDLHLRAILKGYHYRFFTGVDNYLRRNVNVHSIGKDSLSEAHIISHLALLSGLESLMSHNKNYLARLSALFEWLGAQALKRGYRIIAIEAFRKALEIHFSIRLYINILWVLFFSKVIFKNRRSPNFGTMRKIHAGHLQK